MQTLNEILAAAQALPPAERAQLIATLWKETDPVNWIPPSDAWIEEARRRSELLDAGKISRSPWPEVRERARRRAGLDE